MRSMTEPNSSIQNPHHKAFGTASSSSIGLTHERDTESPACGLMRILEMYLLYVLLGQIFARKAVISTADPDVMLLKVIEVEDEIRAEDTPRSDNSRLMKQIHNVSVCQ